MLQSISIQDFGLIEDLELTFHSGLVCFTGETGAGKSMLVDAVLAALGGKCPPDRIRTGAESARFSLHFSLTPELSKRLSDMGIDIHENEILITREIPLQGRSRIWINGKSASFSLVRQLGVMLVEIIGQHESQALLRPETHLDYLDLLGGLSGLRLTYQDALKNWRHSSEQFHRFSDDKMERARERENLERELAEIQAANLLPDEDTKLKERRNILRSANTIMEKIGIAISHLDEEHSGIEIRLAEVYRAMEEAADIDSRLDDSLQSLSDAQEMISELSRGLTTYGEEFVFSPDELAQIEERLDLIDRLGRRFGQGVSAINTYAANANRKLEELINDDEDLDELQKTLLLHQEEVQKTANKLHLARIKASRDLEEAMKAELAYLSMEKAQFRSHPSLRMDDNSPIIVDSEAVFCDERGCDELEFLFSANPGEPPKPLSKVASGGELSRLMLALKTTAASSDGIPTLVFDEVDVGIGGTTAHAIGERLKMISRDHQVLVVTHLPQIAARGDYQIAIEKEEKDGRTIVNSFHLDSNGRLDEIARMLGGGKPPTPTTLHLADELLKLANRE